MRQQAIIIGLGQFGMSLARTLTEHHVEVIAVDVRPDRVQEASVFATQALTMDATAETELASLDPGARNLCICAIGDDAREASILVTALLRQYGAKRIISRASDALLERILHLVGASDVVNPERAFGERYARRLLYNDLVAEVPLGDDLILSEMRPRPAMVGHSLVSLALPRRFGLTVLAIRTGGEGAGAGQVKPPEPSRALDASDILIVVGPPGAVAALHEQW